MTSDERIAKLEARVAALESGTHKASGAEPGDTLKLDMLHNKWADRSITKLPSNWKGRSLDVLKKYSDLDAKEAADLASFFEWKAKKGREEVPVRMSNKTDKKTGQLVPWHESDSFTAKILRTWSLQKSGEKAGAKPNPDAARYGLSAQGNASKHSAPPEPDAFDVENGDGSSEDIPF